MYQKLYYYIKISRPVNCLITIFTIYIAGLIADKGNLLIIKLLLAALSGGFTCAAGNIINDVFDIEIDRINKPNRILPSGRISKTESWVLYLICNITALILSSFINLIAFLIVFVTILLLFIYSYKLKHIMLLGNITVAGLTGLAFIYGGISVDNFSFTIIPAVFAFLVNLIREIVKDMEDIEGDSRHNVITLPKKFGLLVSIRIIFVLTVLLILTTIYPFLIKYYKIEYFISIMIFVNVLFVYFLKSIGKDNSKRNLKRMSTLLKVNMMLGLVSIFLGV